MWFYHLVQSRCAPPFVWEPLLRRNREVSVNTSAACHSRGANIIQELAQFSALETTMENLRVAESSAPPARPTTTVKREFSQLQAHCSRLSFFCPLLPSFPLCRLLARSEAECDVVLLYQLVGRAAEGGRHQKAAAASDAAISHETFTITVVEEGERGINSE